MNFSSEDYLPNSEARINNLRRVIGGRPVAILTAGPSIVQLEERIGELRHADICYFGLNSFVQETHILQQIDRHNSVFMCSALRAVPNLIENIAFFLNRDEENMFVSSFWRDAFGLIPADFDLNEFLRTFDKKLIFFYLSYSRTVPNRDHPLHFVSGNSLQMLIQLAIIGKASRIVLFGADGGCKEDVQEYYYRESEYRPSPSALEGGIITDTNMAFNPIMPISIRNTYATYKISPINILNCSENSFYTPFPKVSYDDAFEYLLATKKFNPKSDLRVPKVTVVTPAMESIEFLKETIESVSNQSYSNHEHIVVYNEGDDEIRDALQQFSNVRWISETNCDTLLAFKKGVSLARGEYICYCPTGDMYANPDWLNTCIGILENHPETSLVWGLCQHMSHNGALGRIINVGFLNNPPPQGKEFIYYWFKKKTLFPQGNLCVRKRVLEECFPFNENISDERETWLSFNYNFNTSSYLPCFIPVVANCHRMHSIKTELRRIHDGYDVPPFYYTFLTASSALESEEAIGDAVLRRSLKAYYWNIARQAPPSYFTFLTEGEERISRVHWQKSLDAYYQDVWRYRNLLFKGKVAHKYRDGRGKVLPGHLSRSSLLFHSIHEYNEKILPSKYFLIYHRVRLQWQEYRWSIIKTISINLSRRFIKRILGERVSAYLYRQVFRAFTHGPAHIKDLLVLRYYLTRMVISKRLRTHVTATNNTKLPKSVNPHVLFITEKWCEGNPDFGPSNDEHNFSGSLEASNLATQDNIFVDEYHRQHHRAFDTKLLLKCIKNKPDLIFISWYRSPNFQTLKFIRERFHIPIIVWWGDSVNHMDEAESFLPFVDLNLVVDSTTAYLQTTCQPEKYLAMWTPQDPRIYYDPNTQRDVDICFTGTMTNHPDRLAGISALRLNGIDVYQTGGQREYRLPTDEYAHTYMRSKIALNFCYHPNLATQLKGRVFEITLCGAMLLESENSETAKWFEPMVEYVPFSDEKDLVEKVKYYLTHESERMDIAAKGHQKAKEMYTAERFWKTVFEWVLKNC